MKKTITAIFLLAAAGVVQAGNPGEFLRKQIDGWFAEAKPAAKGVWLTDAKGCLVSAVDDGTGIKLVHMLDDRKQPICRK